LLVTIYIYTNDVQIHERQIYQSVLRKFPEELMSQNAGFFIDKEDGIFGHR